jgi:hypothetical protein
MKSQENENSEQILRNQQLTLLDLLDRLLDKGVMAKGEILLSVADIDLVYLNLGLLLSSVKTVEHAARKTRPSRRPSFDNGTSGEFPSDEAEDYTDTFSAPEESSPPIKKDEGPEARSLPPDIDAKPSQAPEPRANVDPKNVEKGLARLVLTLVDLLRKLMEKQAIRRIEDDQLSAQEIEKVGNAFFILDEKMEELKEVFGLKDEDLNLNLGPLGDLL